MKKLIVNKKYDGKKLNKFLLDNVPNLTYSLFCNTLRKKDIKINGKKVNEKYILQKDDILDLYLNVIYVGPNIYGVGAGSKYYFNEDIQNISLAESAFLAGINNSPNSYNPFSDESNNDEKIKKRTKRKN